MTAFLLAVFIASLTGSLHCAGMCGPFALMAGLCGGAKCGDQGQQSFRWLPTGCYHAGRMTSYVVVGLIAGSLGAAVDLGGEFAGLQRTATGLAGLLMMAVGVIGLARQAGWLRSAATGSGLVARLIQPLLRRALSLPPMQRAAGIGLLTVLMPCGWLYVFAISAAATGSPWWGAATMLVFWSGTVPVLAGLVLGVSSFSSRLRLNVAALTPLLVIGLGLYTALWRAPVVLGETGSPAVATTLTEATIQLDQATHEPLPCCDGK
jgi:uncharacterized protein